MHTCQVSAPSPKPLTLPNGQYPPALVSLPHPNPPHHLHRSPGPHVRSLQNRGSYHYPRVATPASHVPALCPPVLTTTQPAVFPICPAPPAAHRGARPAVHEVSALRAG